MADSIIAVWFSCGAASAIAAKLTVELYEPLGMQVRIVNNPVAEEDSDNRRFMSDVSDWIGKPIEYAVNENYPSTRCEDVWSDRRFMSGPTGAPCTIELKKKARQQWEKIHKPAWHVLGFTVDEQKRHERFIQTERENVLPVLIQAGLTKQDCMNELVKAGIKPPLVYELGYPNANCIGCVKATSPTYWNHVRKHHPDIFWQRALLSRALGARLVRVNNERIFLDQLDPDAKGRSLKSMTIECGTFCEEPEF